MPSIIAHMITAKKVSEKLNISSDDFIKGNLLPDIIDSNNSHYKIKSGVYLIPDINYYVSNHDLSSNLNKGYLTHLLLDKHFLSEYLNSLYPNTNIFLDGLIYIDYDYLNDKLIHRFNINVDELIPILKTYDNITINSDKLMYNINCLKRKTEGNLNYLNIDDFSNYLNYISETISEELKYYENEFSKCHVHTRERKK